MDFFNKIGDSIVSATQEVSEKAKDMTGIAKLQLELRTKEDTLNKKYQEIGKMFYENNQEVIPEEYMDSFEDVEATISKINELKEEIAQLKGGIPCPKCGAIVAGTASFCGECGAKINDIFEEEE